MQNDQIVFALARIGTLLKSLAWGEAEALGVNPTQAQILARLAARGPSRISDLAREIGVSQPTLSDAAAALLRKGLLARGSDEGDGRVVRLQLTEQGRMVAEAARVPAAVMLEALDVLAPADLGALQRGLVGLIRALQGTHTIPGQRLCVTCAHFRPNAHDDVDSPHHCTFVDAAFGDAALRIDCGDHKEAARDALDPLWARFSQVA